MAEDHRSDFVELAAEIVAAYVSNNPASPNAIPELLASVHRALEQLAGPAPAPQPEPPKPPISIKKTITPDHLISLEDGKSYKILKPHLTVLGMTPDEYRAKWGLPADYPMVAPNYAKARSNLAKQNGLGRKPGTPAPKKQATRKRTK